MKKIIIIILLFSSSHLKLNAQEITSSFTLITTDLMKQKSKINFNWAGVVYVPLPKNNFNRGTGDDCDCKPGMSPSDCIAWKKYCGDELGSGASTPNDQPSGPPWYIFSINSGFGDISHLPTGPTDYSGDAPTHPVGGNHPHNPPPPPATPAEDDPNQNPTKPRPPKDSLYYITLNEDTAKYYDNNTIAILPYNTNYKLTIHAKTGVLTKAGLIWKKITTQLSQFDNSDTASLLTFPDKTYMVEVKQSNKSLLKIKIRRCQPYVIFEPKDNFNWEYGWDDQSSKYDLLKIDFIKLIIPHKNNNDEYYPKWLSVAHQTTIQVKAILKDYISELNKNSQFKITIKANSNAQINGTTNFIVNGTNAQETMPLSFYAQELGSTINAHLRDSVIAINSFNDTVGKQYFSCEKPITKKIVFVYVKTNSGSYPTNKNATLIDFLNTKSHNQLLRKWKVEDRYSNLLYYPTQLDLSNKIAQLNTCKTSDSVLNFLKREYANLYFTNSAGVPYITNPINLTDINKKPNLPDDDNSASPTNVKTRFYFITDMSDFYIPNPDDNLLAPLLLKGSTERGGCYGFSTSEGFSNITIAHELGHALHLLHTFPILGIVNNYPNLPYTQTNNYMDYFDTNNLNDIRNKFYYHQWYHPSNVNGVTVGSNWVW